MSESRILRKEQLESILRWAAPDVAFGAAPPAAGARSGKAVTAQEIEEIQRQAHAEGFERGRAEGREAGRAEMQAQADRLKALCDLLARPLDALDEAVEGQLLHLVTVIAQQMIRRELKSHPGEIVAVVRETLSALPVAAGAVRVHLHPDDAALVRETLTPPEGESGWQIIEDPVITPGGCRVVTEYSRIDATVEGRLNALVAALLGGEREGDRAPEA